MRLSVEIRPWSLALGLALMAYPLVAPSFWTFQIGAQSLILGTIALSLTFLAGYGGMVSLAQMTVAGVAGYATAYFGVNGAGIGIPLPWPLTVAVAIALGTLAGAFIGLLATRTRGIYTIMITLAIAVAFAALVQQNYDIFNGHPGFNGVAPPVVDGLPLGERVTFYYLALVIAAAGYCGVLYLARTPFGLALQGLRDSPRRTAALGFDVGRHGVAAFAVAGLIASAGGVLSVWYNQRISPGSVGLQETIDILVIAVVGGLGHPIGAFIGAVVFTLIDNFAIDLIDRERFNTLIGLVFLVIVLVSPDGLVGLWLRLRRAWEGRRAAGDAGEGLPAKG